MNENPPYIPSVSSCSKSLYAATKITRGPLTLYKRYPGEASEYYVRLTSPDGRRLTRKLLRTADESFKAARRLADDLAAGRFQLVDATKARQPGFSPLQALYDRYETAARGITGISAATVHHNLNALKNIIAAVGPVPSPGGATCSILTADLLETYKSRRLDSAGADQLAQRTAKITANSTLRQARSLFAKKLGSDFYANLRLPDLTKFMAVRQFEVTKLRFRRPAQDLIDQTRAHALLLRRMDPAAYLVYLLAAGAGLRKDEIAHARLHWLEQGPDGQTWIRIQTEAEFSPKNHRERRVPLSPEAAAAIQELTTPAPDPTNPQSAIRNPQSYILPGSMTERTDHVFRRHSAWLRNLGWTTKKTTHQLRKLYGDEVVRQAGIRAGQCLLGHAQVTTTEEYYADPATSIPRLSIVA